MSAFRALNPGKKTNLRSFNRMVGLKMYNEIDKARTFRDTATIIVGLLTTTCVLAAPGFGSFSAAALTTLGFHAAMTRWHVSPHKRAVRAAAREDILARRACLHSNAPNL